MKRYFGILLLFLLSCQKDSCPNAVKAKFRDVTGIGGCGMEIELLDGRIIEPTNLNDFSIDQKDGAKIWISYHSVQTGGTTCMMGEKVKIDCISER